MMFLTEVEAAQVLSVPVSSLRRLEVHQCPQGYHLDAIKDYCAQHGLPVGNWYNVIAVKNSSAPTHIEGVIWCDTQEEMLWRASKFTRAMIIPSESRILWDFIQTIGGTRLIVVGESKLCHISADSWERAISIGCQQLR